MFLEGRRHDLMKSLGSRMQQASDSERFEQAASYRDLLRTLTEIEERQKIAAARAMIPTFSRGMPSLPWWPSTSSTCAAAALWIAAIFTGKTRNLRTR